jgi:hypothetical protein
MKEFRFILKNEKTRIYDRFAIFLVVLILAAAYFNPWFAILMTLVLILFFISRRKLVVHINKDGIHYPSFPGRRFQWDKLSNVMIRDGMLTIDFKNNRIIQQLIEDQPGLIEAEFNQFCKKAIQNGP